MVYPVVHNHEDINTVDNLKLTSTLSSVAGYSSTLSSPECSQDQDTSSPSPSFIDEAQENHKIAVRDELGPVPEVTVEFMLDHIVPNSNVDVEATMMKLKEADIWSEESRWKVSEVFCQQRLSSTKDQNAIEGENLLRIRSIYNSIISNAQFHDIRSREPTLTFEHPSPSSLMAECGPTAELDIFGTLNPQQEIHTNHLKVPPISKETRSLQKMKWFDKACVWEFKANDRTEDLNENTLNMVWSLHRIMQVDHRRRSIFGITVEKEDMRIWFTCREVLFVTRPFNFSTHPAQLVQLVASLAHATPTQLGYDPTMKLRWRDNTFQYDIECKTKQSNGSKREVIYQTQKVLSDTACDLRGRATRVYLALAVDQNNPSATNRLVVLKDSWVDADCPQEGETHRQILEGASEEEKKLFLAVYQYGIVQIDNQEDSTKYLMLKGKKVKVTKIDSVRSDPAEAKQVREIGIFNLYTPTAKDSGPSIWKTEYKWQCPPGAKKYCFVPIVWEPEVYSPKIHYRIVFEDVGESLRKIVKSGRATIRILERSMCDMTRALHYLAKKGYVHRDVSSGNILWFGDHAKLSDLEFSRQYGTGGSSDTCTGTFKFMAGEVMAGEYSIEGRDPEDPSARFIYNPVHDLESLWWVGVWCTMCFFPPPRDQIRYIQQDGTDKNVLVPATPTQYTYRKLDLRERGNLSRVRYFANQLFPPSENYSAYFRMEEIHHEFRFGNRLDNESPDFFQAFTYCLDNARKCLSLAYREIHKELPRIQASYFTDVLRIASPPDLWYHDPTMEGTMMFVHDRILQVFQLTRKLAEFEDINLWPIHSMELYKPWLAEHREQGPCCIEDCAMCADLDF